MLWPNKGVSGQYSVRSDCSSVVQILLRLWIELIPSDSELLLRDVMGAREDLVMSSADSKFSNLPLQHPDSFWGVNEPNEFWVPVVLREKIDEFVVIPSNMNSKSQVDLAAMLFLLDRKLAGLSKSATLSKIGALKLASF